MSADIAYKYVFIKGHLGKNSYLDIEGGKGHAGVNVICYSNNGDDNQIWFFDTANKAIRSKLNEFCIEYLPGKNALVVNPFNPHNPNQKWEVHLPHIRLQADPQLTLAIINDDDSKGAKVSALRVGNNLGQEWSFEDAGGHAKAPANYNPSASVAGAFGGAGAFGVPSMTIDHAKREFLISSAMNGNLVVDIRGDDAKAGAEVIMYQSSRKKNQMWYVDKDSHVRSCLNDMVFHADSKGHSLKMTPYTGDRKHQWRLEGRKIVNGEGHCLDIRGGKCRKGDELCPYEYKGDENQHWNMLY